MASSPSQTVLPGGYASVLALTAAVQFVLVAVSFPLGELFSATPLLHIDAAHHWYQVKVAVDLAQQGRLIGYDPFFAAGYLGGIPYNTSAKAPAAIAVFSGGWVSPAVAFKLFSVGSAIVGPLAIPLALRSLGLDARIGAIAAFLTLILWWASPIRWYHTAGIVAWPVAALMASWFAAGLTAYVTGRTSTRAVAGMTALGCVLFFVHPLFPLAAFFALAPLVWTFAREIMPRRLLAVLVVVPVICVAFNLPWIMAMTQTPGMAGGMQPYQQVVDINMFWQNMLGLPGQGRGSKFYFLLVFFGLWGVIATQEQAQKCLATALFLGGLGTTLFADVGSVIRIVAVVQPNRFSFQGYVLLLLPAALGVVALISALRTTGIVRGSAAASAAFGAVAIAFYVSEVHREISTSSLAHYGFAPPEVREPGPLSRWALDQLRQETDAGARVIFELSHARIHDDAHMAGYLAVTSDREFIGGAYPYTHFANAWDNWMFGRSLDALPVARFQGYLELYNVGWVLAHSDGLKRYLASVPNVSLVSSKDSLSLYRVAAKHSFFLQGTGKVAARGVNRIDLSGLQGDVVVLKYHYVPGMRAEPNARVDGVKLFDDPEPFIRISQPPPSVRLYLP